MEKIRVAVIGYGNIGRYTIQALQAAPDMEIAGVVRRAGAEGKPAELTEYNVVKNIEELGKVDVIFTDLSATCVVALTLPLRRQVL